MSHLLFEPITLRDLTVRNRVWVPPMCQYSVHERDGKVTPGTSCTTAPSPAAARAP